MPPDADPPLFWAAVCLTIGGAVLTLWATGILLRRAIREKRALDQRLASARRINAERAAERERSYRSQRRPIPGRPESDPESAEESLRAFEKREAELDEAFVREVGRAPNEGSSWGDVMVLPELMAKRIVEDQLAELRLPAALVALGVLVSTAGSIVSLWV